MRKICSTFNATDGKISYSTEASTGSGNNRSVTVSLFGVTKLDEYRDEEFVTSRAALMYFKSMTPEATAKYDEVRVSVVNGDETFSKAYLIPDLRDMALASDVSKRYMDGVVERRYEGVQPLVDVRYMPDSLMVAFHKGYARMDSANGRFVLNEQVGCKVLVAEQDTVRLPAVVVYTDAMTTDSTLYKFEMYVNRQNMRIAGIFVK